MSFGSPYFTLPRFKYYKPNNVEELLQLLSEHGQNGKIMSGGVGLLAFMKERLVAPESIFSISRIPDFKKLEASADHLKIGASVHLSDLETEYIYKNVPTLYKAVKKIADPTIRNMGTLVGDLAEALPWADAYPTLISLEAEAIILKKGSSRKVPVNGLVQGLGQINVGEDEVISEVLIPLRRTRGTYLKFANGSEYGLATVALTYFVDERRFNFVVGSVSETPVLIKDSDFGWEFEGDLSKNSEKLEKYIDEKVNTTDDLLASASFRKNIVKYMALQAVKEVFVHDKD